MDDVHDENVPPDVATLLHRTLRKLAYVRAQLASARAIADAEKADARAYLRKMQDIQAEAFRLNEQLKLARLDADESYSRVLDLEAELRREQVSFVALHERTHEVGENLRQVMATHQKDNAIWHAEVARVHALHEHDNARWRAEVERLNSELASAVKVPDVGLDVACGPSVGSGSASGGVGGK